MGIYEQIEEAKKLFGLNDSESVSEIRRKINTVIKKWHPDTGNEEDRKEKSIRLLKARKIILDYVTSYRISFEKEEIEKYLAPEELWKLQYGNDRIWGSGK